MKRISLFVVIFCVLTISSTAFAARGVVVYFDNYASQKMVIYDYSLGTFSCGHSYIGSYLTMERDVVVGNVSFLGIQQLYNLRTDDTFTIFIEQCYLDLSGAKEWLRNNY